MKQSKWTEMFSESTIFYWLLEWWQNKWKQHPGTAGVNQKRYENFTADDYRNIDNAVEAGAAVKEFTENH